MPTPTFDANFCNAIGNIAETLKVEMNKFVTDDQNIIKSVIDDLKTVAGSADISQKTSAWDRVIKTMAPNLKRVNPNSAPDLEVVMLDTNNNQKNDEIYHWQMQNMLMATYEAVMVLAERQTMAEVSDKMKAFRDAENAYINAKDDAIKSISKEYYSVGDLDVKYAQAVADEKKYTELVAQLEMQKDYRQDSYQALHVTLLSLTDEKKKADEAYDAALKERDEQVETAKRARDTYDRHVKAMKLKEEELRKRSEEINAKRDALNAELAKLAKDVEGETSATVNAVSELQQQHAAAKAAVADQLKTMTKKPKSEPAKRANRLHDLLEGSMNHQRIWTQVKAFTTALEDNPKMAALVEQQGDGYTRQSEANLAIIRKINTDTTRMGLQYLEMYNTLKKHYEELDAISSRYEVDGDGNYVLDSKGNQIKKQGYTEEFVATCHNLKDLLHHANQIDSVYRTLINQAVEDSQAPAKEQAVLKKLRDVHFTYSSIEFTMHAAQDHLDAKQNELNKFCISIYDESEQIKEEMKDLLSDAQVNLRTELLEKANREEARLNEMNKDVETKRDEARAAFDKLFQIKKAIDHWKTTERAHKDLKEAKEAKAKHLSYLNKINKAHEAHEAMYNAANAIKADMPGGKLDQKFYDGTATHVFTGLGKFLQTADIGREDLKKFTDPKYDRNAYNSNEYNAMIAAIRDAGDLKKLKDMSPDQMNEKLAAVRAAAQHYLDAKKAQRFHWIPSAQRKTRLAYAEEVIRFCDQATISVNSVKERAVSLEDGYVTSKVGDVKSFHKSDMNQFITVSVEAESKRAYQQRNRINSRSVQNDQPEIGAKTN